ncbi:WbqC family protein [Megalodesulfovibrio gigas]|uniref:Putative WbqC-like family protein n=1 Tax=Megalodesulfovibrio gigas (strain ATCC 19364 / DSM 1382 / NCIMB 9332 / VKM B-1759) TaxID=1121448 RepID=T2GG96_MEGG1|nr:WbqC family protein [Megalodesulfovibrio gigas]AGW15017.1 putative WbqC-like family protein [Megalodesulfovibrio gigas DSM 1382 = ATCC 19364]
MQPYFFPYAGYFRLLAGVDCFVLLDCVQFNRRGRVHRTEVPAPAGGTQWLTLPLARQPRETCIRDLAFAADARSAFDARLHRHPWLAAGSGPASDRVRAFLGSPLLRVMDFIEAGVHLVADLLDLRPEIILASTLELPPDVRGQDRIIAIVKALQGTEYLNAPGGRSLYDSQAFEQAGLQLEFLPPYGGDFPLLLPALMSVDPREIQADIRRTMRAPMDIDLYEHNSSLNNVHCTPGRRAGCDDSARNH